MREMFRLYAGHFVRDVKILYYEGKIKYYSKKLELIEHGQKRVNALFEKLEGEISQSNEIKKH